MSHPRVVNCTRASYDVYVGKHVGRLGLDQPGGWENPFLGADALAKYIRHLERCPWLITAAVYLLPGKVLGCWHAPGIGHADVLARLADGEHLQAIKDDVLLASIS